MTLCLRFFRVFLFYSEICLKKLVQLVNHKCHKNLHVKAGILFHIQQLPHLVDPVAHCIFMQVHGFRHRGHTVDLTVDGDRMTVTLDGKQLYAGRRQRVEIL